MKLKRIILQIFVLLLFSRTGFAQKTEFLKVQSAAAYPFMLYLPVDSIMKTHPPLIIFLHGRSLSGTDLNMLTRYGPLDAIERGKTINAVVAAPQVKKSQSWEPEKVITVLDYVKKKYTIDTSRVYVIGMSLGGYGTFDFVGAYPDKIAAAAALCGGGRLKDACNITRTNLWIQHGKKDRAVNYSESVKMYNAIIACNPKANCFLTLYPNLGHGELAHEFMKDTLYNWLYKFRLQQKSPADTGMTDSLKKIIIQDKDTSAVENKPQLNADKKPENKKPDGDKKYYTIKKGDTLYAIALRNKTTVKNLCKLNGIKEDAVLHIGQRILLKE
jgi:dienelactone hydrolase